MTKRNIHVVAMKRGAPYILGFFIFLGLFIKFPAFMFFLFIGTMLGVLCYCIGRLVMTITKEEEEWWD